MRGDPQRYRALNLALSTMPTVLFTPAVYALRAVAATFFGPASEALEKRFASWAAK